MICMYLKIIVLGKTCQTIKGIYYMILEMQLVYSVRSQSLVAWVMGGEWEGYKVENEGILGENP